MRIAQVVDSDARRLSALGHVSGTPFGRRSTCLDHVNGPPYTGLTQSWPIMPRFTSGHVVG